VSPSLHLKTKRDPVSKTLCFLVFRIPDDGQNPETQWFWVLYTVVRTLWIIIDELTRRSLFFFSFFRTLLAVLIIRNFDYFQFVFNRCLACVWNLFSLWGKHVSWGYLRVHMSKVCVCVCVCVGGGEGNRHNCWSVSCVTRKSGEGGFPSSCNSFLAGSKAQPASMGPSIHGVVDWGVKLTNCILMRPTLRIPEIIPPLTHKLLWRWFKLTQGKC
jgi:hypothetical protein